MPTITITIDLGEVSERVKEESSRLGLPRRDAWSNDLETRNPALYAAMTSKEISREQAHELYLAIHRPGTEYDKSVATEELIEKYTPSAPLVPEVKQETDEDGTEQVPTGETQPKPAWMT